MIKKVISSEPDYEFWCKLDSWNFKDAALLLHWLDPLDFKHIQFTTKEVPHLHELKEAYKTFLLFKNVQWGNAHPDYTNSAHLHDIYIVALNKNLSIPEKFNYFLVITKNY